MGDVCIDDLVIRSALQLSTVRVESLPIEVQRAAALFNFLVVAVGVSRTLPQDLLERWALSFSFRQMVFTSPDGHYNAATTLPPIRRCQVSGGLLDELRLVMGTAPLLHANLLPSGGLRQTPRYGCTLEERWQLCKARHAGSLACVARFGQGERMIRATQLTWSRAVREVLARSFSFGYSAGICPK